MRNKLDVPKYVKDVKDGTYTIDTAIKKILDENNIVSPPVNVFKIARSMNFDLFSVNFDDDNIKGIMVDGDEKYKPFNSKRFIVINKNDYSTRQLFTIGHEIGHFILHCNNKVNFYERYTENKNCIGDTKKELIERQADFFSASLLMPSAWVDDFVLKLKIKSPNIKDNTIITLLSQYFLVSEETAKRRLLERKKANKKNS